MDNRSNAVSTGAPFERDDKVIQATKEFRDDLLRKGAKHYGLSQADHKQFVDMLELMFDVESQFSVTCNPFLNVTCKQIRVLGVNNELLAARSEYMNFLAANHASIFKPDTFKLYQAAVSKFNEKAATAAKVIKEINDLKAAGLPQVHLLHALNEKLNKLNQAILGVAVTAFNNNAIRLSAVVTGNMFERAKGRLALFKHAFCDDQGNLTSYNRTLSDIDATIQTMAESVKAGCAATDLFKSQVAQIAAAKAKQQQGMFQPAAPATPLPTKAGPPVTPGFRRAISATAK